MRATAAALAFAAVTLAAPAPARGGTEEFSTFDIAGQERDDESLLDHLLNRPPRAWRAEWDGAAQALRTSQGCLTTDTWFIDTRLKLRTPLGDHARFGLDVTHEESDRVAYQYFDFSLRFPSRYGAPGLMFRPLYDKSRQDLALFWEAGAETSVVRAQATFTIEDAFNNLWEFRQARVGNVSEPYERHPFEPAAWLLARRERWRFELGGRYLTPSRRRLARDPATGFVPRATLWGALGWWAIDAPLLGLDWELAGETKQARSTETRPGQTLPGGGDYRRQWSAEIAARRRVTRDLEAEARWIYQERSQHVEPPLGNLSLEVQERVVQVETRYAFSRAWTARAGVLVDRVSVARRGSQSVFTYGSRTESRAYLGFAARFGRVSLYAVEGFELDREPYEVWGIHDKAFVHLQTTF